MSLALRHAVVSPDPSTQNAAVIVDASGNLLLDTLSVNEFPEGVKYEDDRWLRPIKYSYIEHAERNAIYAAAALGESTSGATLVCPWAACADCARGIIQSGISTLVTLRNPEELTHARWDDSISVAMRMLEEAQVDVIYMDAPEVDVELRRNGKPFRPYVGVS